MAERPEPEVRATRIAHAAILALQELDGIHELDALGVLLQHTDKWLAEIRGRLQEIQVVVNPRQ